MDMKSLTYLFALALFLSSCMEVAPTIPQPNLDSDRKVLVEEFSGAKCKPCAAAKADLDNLLETYGENLIVVTIHSKSFPGVGDPNPGARYDFRTDKGAQLLDLLGRPLGIPSAYVDRRIFEGEPDRPLGRTQWGGFIAQELDRSPSVGLNINTEFDDATRELTVGITMVPSEDIDGDIRLTVMITENELIDKQLTDNGLVEDFEHEHILREVLTAIDGDKITESFTRGSIIEKTLKFTMPDEDGWWVANHCNVVAFLSLMDGDNTQVLQADEVHLGD